MDKGFFGDLLLKFVNGTTWVVHQEKDKPFGFKLADGRAIVPRHGQPTDFASIPWFFRRVLPKTGTRHMQYGRSAVIHDVLYRTQEIDGQQVERAFADWLMKEAMVLDGVPKIIALIIYVAVRIGGAKAWKESTHKLGLIKTGGV